MYTSNMYQQSLSLRTVAAILAAPLLIAIWRIYRWRAHIWRLRAAGMPMPPWNAFFGHLGIAARITSKLPVDANGQYLPDQIRQIYPDLGPNFYLDLYPMAPSMLVLNAPDALYQITQTHPLAKFPALRSFLKPLTDGLDIVTMEDAEWKKWRKIFNPGFSASHLMSLVPVIVRETETFISMLNSLAEQQKMTTMKDHTDNLTMDIIGEVVLNTHFDCQRLPNTFVNSIRRQVLWLSFGAEPNLFVRYHPLRPLAHWYYSRTANSYVKKELNARIEEFLRQGAGFSKSRSIIDLALGAYLDERTKADAKNTVEIDPFFKQICASQIKLFLFSGHDTTSSSICYLLYLLSTHPTELERLREEHDSVLSKEVDKTAKLISENPNILNQLPYTLAVIKEMLRLYPPVSSTRAGEADFHVIDKLGQKLPTEDFLVWSNPHSIQNDPRLWPQPDKFIPDRWLVESPDPLHPTKGTWRPFEHGPRNCIGQELAMIEMKVILCLFARTLTIEDCYAELDQKYKLRPKEVSGERAYQVQRSQPEEDLPCRIISVKAGLDK